MRKIWQNLTTSEKLSSAQAVAAEYNIDETAVEKDWWVTAVLKAMSKTKCGEYLLFRGGTSLSKGWKLINRFSEDVDMSIERNFFAEMGYKFAHVENNTQIRKLKETSRDYIHNVLSAELYTELEKLGARGFRVTNMTEVPTKNGMKPIDHDTDPTAIFVEYNSVFKNGDNDLESRVKVEISCMSMDEPYEIKRMTTMIHDKFPDIDKALTVEINTVSPTRTFLEKAFMLNEEFQKMNPRYKRMSRHLYDLERIMDTKYGSAAIKDNELYKAIVEHRRKFYHLKYVDYDKNYPPYLNFIPEGALLNAFRKDYEENMVGAYIYGEAVSFDDLISRLEILRERFQGK